MAEPVSKLVLDVLKHDCSMHSCPYKYGDETSLKRLGKKLEDKLKHRVSDGNEVRNLGKKIKQLEGQLEELKNVVVELRAKLAKKGR